MGAGGVIVPPPDLFWLIQPFRGNTTCWFVADEIDHRLRADRCHVRHTTYGLSPT